MKAPGVEVRPLRQMTGGASFNEVLLQRGQGARQRPPRRANNGWNVALTTLMNERAAIGAGGGGGGGVNLYAASSRWCATSGSATTPWCATASPISSSTVASPGYNNQRAMDKIKAGQMPGPELSIAKLAGTMNMRRLGDFVSHVLGPKLIADSGEWGTYAWSMLVLGTPGGRIAGGSDEVMRNIVGERVLGLPKEPGIDSKSPFRELKVGTQTK
jgi:alkylation response protein AidB-like acyl-CoA dehydrogenase